MTGKELTVPFWTLATSAFALTVTLAGLTAFRSLRPSPKLDDPEWRWQEAQKAIADRDFPKAAAQLSHCLESWPFNAEAHFLMARTCRRAGQMTKWRKHLERAEILRWPVSQIDLERQLRRAQVGDVWEVEEALIDRLNQHPPEEAIILEALISGYMENDRLVDVIFFTSAWIRRFPEDYLPLIYRANARLRLYGKSNNAVEDFERILELKPDHPEAHLSLAIVLTDLGQFKKAVPHFQFCLECQPDDPTGALLGLATCQNSLGNTQEARQTLDQLFARTQEITASLLLRSKIELADGRPEEALTWLKKADTLSPNESDITHALVLVCGQLGRTEQAAQYKRQLDSLITRDAELDRLMSALKYEPDDAGLRFQLAMLCLKLGRDQEASHWFQGILFKDPIHLPTLNALANYYESKGKPKLANHYRRKAAKVSEPAVRRP